jgi:hypothetical protein
MYDNMQKEKIEDSETQHDMCPNCITPWRCNGPHIPRKHWGRYFPEVYNFLYSLLQ